MIQQLTSEKSKLIIVDQSFSITVRLKNLVNQLESISIVGQAKNYDEAIVLLNSEKVDVVLLDIMIPPVKGIALLRFITRTFPETKVIVVTNMAEDYYKELCFEIGAVHFMDKSAEFEELKSVIVKHISLQ